MVEMLKARSHITRSLLIKKNVPKNHIKNRLKSNTPHYVCTHIQAILIQFLLRVFHLGRKRYRHALHTYLYIYILRISDV